MFCVWHDLRKNPKDLPDEDMLCVIKHGGEGYTPTYAVASYVHDEQAFLPVCHVLAWSRLDEFDEEHSCSMSYMDEQVKGLRSYLNMHKVAEDLAKKIKTLLYYISGE